MPANDSLEKYSDPITAAIGDIPRQHVRVLACVKAPWGDHAIVLLEVSVKPSVIVQVVCSRYGEKWVAGDESEQPSDVGYVAGGRFSTLWPEEPLSPDVNAAIVQDDLGEHVVPVKNGFFLFASWKDDAIDTRPTDPSQPRLVRLVSR
jgi:hypothetical protein